MILSRGRRYLFVHIPKTGGTSMALALEQRAMADDILVGDTPKAVRRKGRLKGIETLGRLWKHSTLADGEGLYARDELQELFVFTLVRNPWDRMVSYYHWLRAQSFAHPAVGLARALDFSAFLRHPTITKSFQGSPYARYLQDSTGQTYGHFIRLEHLETDLAPLEDHLGFQLKMPHVNRSERGDYRRAYSAQDAEVLRDICAKDISDFGYEF